MTVRIRMKMMGRKARPFFRVCAMDIRAPRNGKVIEELGIYDPIVPETDARARLNGERIAYWISKGAQPSDKVAVLIKKYGLNGTHLAEQQAALEKLKTQRRQAPAPYIPPPPKPEEPAPAAEAPASEAPAEGGEEVAASAPAEGGEQASE